MSPWTQSAIPIAIALGGACDTAPIPSPDLERMLEQPRYEAYEVLPHSDERAMLHPPKHTVSRESEPREPLVQDGIRDGQYAVSIPTAVDRKELVRARCHYEVFCGACHGIRGDGDTVVGRAMVIRKPPSLLSDPIRSRPPGRVYEAITKGYGLMPSYANELTVTERWAIVGYLDALRLSQGVSLDDLTPVQRAHALGALK